LEGKAEMGKTTTVQIPILIGEDYRHLMGTAEILEEVENSRAKVVLSVTASGAPEDARDLVALFTTGELALQFVAIPVTPRSTKNQ
jgi:hypothetical protein